MPAYQLEITDLIGDLKKQGYAICRITMFGDSVAHVIVYQNGNVSVGFHDDHHYPIEMVSEIVELLNNSKDRFMTAAN